MEVFPTKGTRDENFPVGSFLLSRSVRPHIAEFYALARAADDIADNANVAEEEKLAKLNRFERALTFATKDDPAAGKAYSLALSCSVTGVTTKHAVDLIQAFKQDVTKLRYDDWDDLMRYCNLSAAPVGRFLLDLHGEGTSAYIHSDALCNVLQVLNHLQDIKSDYQNLNRVYLPQEWMAEFQLNVADFNGQQSTPALRAVIDRCLDRCEQLMVEARKLPKILKSRRLMMEVVAIICLAERLAELLKTSDPIAVRVNLTKADFFKCGVIGVVGGLFGYQSPSL